MAYPRRRHPDMGNVSADGAHLWLSSRFDGVAHRIGTATCEVAKTKLNRTG